ncbi:MAG: hypothetical protein AB7V32_09520 [Candidatus Berkiella sp.]
MHESEKQYAPAQRLYLAILLGDDRDEIERAKQAVDFSEIEEFSNCLKAAIEKGNSKIVPWLLEYGVFQYCYHYTFSYLKPNGEIYHDPIEHAIKRTQLAIAKILINSNLFELSLNVLRLAIIFGYDDVVQSLLQKDTYSSDQLLSLSSVIASSVVLFGERMLKPFLATNHFDPLEVVPALVQDEEGEALLAYMLFERPDLAVALKERFPAAYAKQRELSMGLIDCPTVTLEEPPAIFSPGFDNMMRGLSSMFETHRISDEREAKVISPLIV